MFEPSSTYHQQSGKNGLRERKKHHPAEDITERRTFNGKYFGLFDLKLEMSDHKIDQEIEQTRNGKHGTERIQNEK